MNKKTTGQRLLAARSKKKLSLREMGKRLQVPMSNYNDWEHDHRFTNMNLAVAKRIRAELGVKLHQLRPDIWTKKMDETMWSTGSAVTAFTKRERERCACTQRTRMLVWTS